MNYQIDVNLIHLVAQLLHDFHVKRFEPVTVGVYEVEAAVNTIIDNVLSVETTLIPKIPENNSNKLIWLKWVREKTAICHMWRMALFPNSSKIGCFKSKLVKCSI